MYGVGIIVVVEAGIEVGAGRHHLVVVVMMVVVGMELK